MEAPLPLAEHHDLAGFQSGVATLDDWLSRRALANQASGASRVYVVCDGRKIAGYYALASGAVSVAQATGRFRRNMRDAIPVVVLGRLAVGQSYQKRGLGRALFRDAALRVLQAASTIGIRGILVHAISPEARNFYLAIGFDPSPLDELTLMITLAGVRAATSS